MLLTLRQHSPFVLLLLLAALCLAACGGESQNLAGATSTPAAAGTASTTPTSVPALPTATPAAPAETPVPATEMPLPPTDTPLPPATDTPLPLTPTAATFPPAIALEPVIEVPAQITYLTHAGDGSGRLFLVEKAGRVRTIDEGELLNTPFLDISGLVLSGGSEQGLLSIAFPPDYAESGRFYVNYTAREGEGDTVIARYRVSPDPNQADPGSAEVLLRFDQPAPNHNGGQLQFGPDGFLYIGTGDGGRAGDPWDNAENLSELLGKMLRIDVSAQISYTLPADNPFLEREDAQPALWAYGLRNPWRFSFDRQTGDLYIADVGQNRYEELNFQPANSNGGEYYGWDTTEGAHCYEPDSNCDTSGMTLPILEYGHDLGCSITGGYVYRGQQHPALAGVYFYADYCSGRIWGARPDGSGGWQSELLLESGANVASFGEDDTGELYVLDLGGRVMRLTAVP